MNRGFYTIMAAQFFSSLADNALLIAAIALLRDIHAPELMTPMLKSFFFVSYVALAAFVGAFADSMPKGRVMFITNLVKVLGCTLMFFGVHPLLAYAAVGFGAAAYSPAKYGILTELLPPEKLVIANGWIEGLTVGSIILGFVVGGILVSPHVAASLLAFDFPLLDFDVETAGEAAIAVIGAIYAIAAAINLGIPDTGARYPRQARQPVKLLADFAHCVATLWRDKLGQISLAVTTLFWGVGATLQFIILKWCEQVLGMSLSQGAIMQAVVAIGIAIGSVWAGARVSLKQSLSVLPVGVAMGLLVTSLAFVNFSHVPAGGILIGSVTLTYAQLLAGCLMILVGAMAGFFVVPMNALLQHRGYVLLSAGHSIAVQNFNENLSILVMLGGYEILLWLKLSIGVIIIGFGLFVAGSMYAVILRHRHNQRQFDSTSLIGQPREHRPGSGPA
jgi:MFS transporter, LPLT family, lysophospholipid transporter